MTKKPQFGLVCLLILSVVAGIFILFLSGEDNDAKIKQLSDFNNPLVRETAARITKSEKTVRGKLKEMFYYVRDDIKFGFLKDGDLVKASDIIKSGLGQCNNKGTLFLAFCKAENIPARIHFSLIKKEIQRGIFSGAGYWLIPDKISHSWLEVSVDGRWRRIDSYINDKEFYHAGKLMLKQKGWDTGYSIANSSGESSIEFNIDKEKFVQMDAVTDDHGVYDDPADYFNTDKYRNRPGTIKMFLYRIAIGRMNKWIEEMREAYVESGVK